MKNYLMILALSLPFFQTSWLTIDHSKLKNSSIMQNENNENLYQDWILTNGFFEDDQLNFEAKNETKHTYGMYRVFTFEKDGKLSFSYFNPSKIMVCGVGLLDIKSGTWALDKTNYLTLYLKGERWGESKFEFKIKYQIEQLDSENFVVKTTERIISKASSHY